MVPVLIITIIMVIISNNSNENMVDGCQISYIHSIFETWLNHHSETILIPLGAINNQEMIIIPTIVNDPQ